MVICDELNSKDIVKIAEIHLKTMDDSIISLLGFSYTKKFYQFIARSEREITAIKRDGAGEVVAACITSLEPHSLGKRLMFHTPLWFFLIISFYRLPWIKILFRMKQVLNTEIVESIELIRRSPELILIFSDPSKQGKGIGTNLVLKTEEHLLSLNTPFYQVRTLDNPNNRALRFYQKCNFQKLEKSEKQGRIFQVLYKQLRTSS